MTRRAARDEVGADSGTPQEEALAIAVWVKRMRERDDWPETDVALMDALDSLLAYIKQLEGQRRRVPSDEGGPGHEERYWLTAKLNACVMHLRDVEDFYRLRGGLPEGFNMIRADRARSLYEQINDDFVNGKTTVPTMRERAEAAEAQIKQLEGERDELAKDGRTVWAVDTDSHGKPMSTIALLGDEGAVKAVKQLKARAEAAERENERLRDALRQVADTPASADDDGLIAAGIARAALARTEERTDA